MNFDDVLQSLWISDTNTLGLSEILITLFLPFFLSFPIVAVYRRVQRNNNFSSSFILALFLFSVLSAQVTLLIGNNIARAFGLVGALSIIRFRSALKDPLDAVFIFWTLAIGMACGTGYYALAAVSVVAGSVMLLTLKAINADRPKYLESVLKVVADKNDSNVTGYLENSFRDTLKGFQKVNEYFDSNQNRKTFVYTLKRKSNTDISQLEETIKQVPGVQEFHHLNQESSLFAESRH